MQVETSQKDLQRLFERTMLDKQYLFDALAGLSLPANARIIDIGCGSGGSAKIMRECYSEAEIYGVDNSASAIQYASELLKNEKITFLNADAAHLPLPDHSFDCCVAKMIFDIIPDPGAILKEMVRLLKPQGTLLIYGNIRSTAQGSPLLKNTGKLTEAYKRYVRLTGWKGFNTDYLRDILNQQYGMTVSVQKIIKDTDNPGREALSRYYMLSEEEIIKSAENNVLARLGLITPEDVIGYETSLNELLSAGNEYLAFEQAILYATKESAQ